MSVQVRGLLAALWLSLIGNEAAHLEHELPKAVVVLGSVLGRNRQLALVDVEPGVLLEIETALFFAWMREEAEADGIELRIESGFRTFREQERLYRCFVDCSCNDCRRAAKPGYSPHESGRAVDLVVDDARVREWLRKHARRFGFARTVRSEPWHFEYIGAERSGTGDRAVPPEPKAKERRSRARHGRRTH